MRRWCFHFLAGVSGVVLLLAVVMWVRGYWVADLSVGCWKGVSWWTASENGRVWFEVWVDRGSADRPARHKQVPAAPLARRNIPLEMEQTVGPVQASWGGAAFGYSTYRDRLVTSRRMFVSLYVWIVIPFAVVPAWWCVSYWRRRKVVAGCCRKCGYDLRASVGRCPECGVGIGDAVQGVGEGR